MIHPVPSSLVLGDARDVLAEYPRNTAQLIFTSPPYLNAKPECFESVNYSDYLTFLGEVFEKCHGVLSEGRFLVVNTSPVLLRRANRSSASRRIPITYDLHGILDKIGFEFVDDIVWEKRKVRGGLLAGVVVLPLTGSRFSTAGHCDREHHGL